MAKNTISESTSAADSLHPNSKAFDDLDLIANEMIRNFAKLNTQQKRRHLETIQTMMGLPDGSKFKFKEELDWPTVAEFLAEDELQAELEAAGFSKDTQDKLADIFFRTIEDRLSQDSFRKQLQELLDNYLPPSPFIDDQHLDVVEALGNRINELQDQIAFVEQESDQIRQELLDNENCNEALDLSRSPRRSTIEECMNTPDEDDAEALFNQDHVGNVRMAQYLRSLGREDI